jgi:lysophospholipase L1-like esterase
MSPTARVYLFAVLQVLGVGGMTGAARAVDVSGQHLAPNKEFGPDASYRLVGDAVFGWQTGEVAGGIDLNGHALDVQTGGGNRTVLGGTISGSGSISWHGGSVPQVGPSILAGDAANTYVGTFTLGKGVLDLAKPAGQAAIAGDLVIGREGPAMVRLANPEQIADSGRVTLAGQGRDPSSLALAGHDETFASLAVLAHAIIDMGGKSARLAVGDSAAVAWEPTATLTVEGHVPDETRLTFGRDAAGLTAAQRSRVGFLNPASLPAGLYTATAGSAGELVPGRRVEAVDPPFDVSPAAIAGRERLYEVPGLDRLCGKKTPLADGLVVSFFGDSLTWQNGYIAILDKALQAGAGTADLRVKLVNRGINGGGVLSLRDGSEKAAYPGDSGQKPFKDVLAADDADVAVVFIGINDVWWRETAPEVFEQGLRDLAATAGDRGTRLVLATMTVQGELPDGMNPKDAVIDAYCEITRRVAKETGATLVDLRSAYLACLRNRNAVLRVDGTLFMRKSGVLTYDGVHPTAEGNGLLANLIADGIARSLQAMPLPH